ncbi:MAG: hypothetical protein CMF96_00800, partial [Candidatus Marinimicrobia bacterium]|nr:hypothetical protein [Candidatus Neomarinimicrobiota bacterium]
MKSIHFIMVLISSFIFSQDHQVEAGSMYYSPQTLVIEVGETVEWYNAGGFHDVVVTDGPETFSLSPVSGPAVIGSITFNLPGNYDYICSVGNHEAMGMVGSIVVNESNQNNPSSIFMTELTDPQNSSDAGRYVELYNSGSSDVDLSS